MTQQVTSPQTIDLQWEREWLTERERERDVGKRWVKGRSGQVHVDEVTAICCQGPDTLWFLILLATVVMNTGGDSRRHTIKVEVHPLVVSLFYTVRLPSLTLSSSLSLPGCFLASHSVVLQSQLSFESVLICLFARKITKQQPTKELVSQWCKTRFSLEKKIVTCKARKFKYCIYSPSITFPKCWKRIKNCY